MKDSLHNPSDDSDAWWDSLYGAMLIEDIRLGVMPIGGRTSDATKFVVQVPEGFNVSTTSVIETILGRSTFYARDLAHAVSDWVAECVVAVVTSGRAEYDLVAEKQSDVVAIRARERHDAAVATDGSIKARVTHAMPEEYATDMSALRSTLRVVSDPLVTGKLLGYFGEARTAQVRIDYDGFHREEARVLARATAFLGWNGRGTFHPEHGQNAFCYVYRELKYHAFIARLRSEALLCLNECLRLAGELMGTPLKIEVSGLFSEADVAKALADLETGQTSFADLLAPFKI